MEGQLVIDSWNALERLERFEVVLWRLWRSATVALGRLLGLGLISAGVGGVTVGVGRRAQTFSARARAHLTRVHAQVHVVGIVQVNHVLRHRRLGLGHRGALLCGVVQLLASEVLLRIGCVQLGLVEDFLKVDERFRVLVEKQNRSFTKAPGDLYCPKRLLT